MIRPQKGTKGYLNYKLKVEIIRTVIYFGIVAAIFLLGYFQTKTRLNMLTVVAVLGCLPSSKALVGVITRFPYRSFSEKYIDEIAKKTSHLTVCYDMIITSRDKIMPLDCAVISGHHLYGYTHYDKVEVKTLASHILSNLKQNGINDISVHILNQYKPFIARAEGLDNIAAVEKENTKETEEKIRSVLLCLSM